MRFQYVYGREDIIAPWVASMIPELRTSFGPCAAIGVVDDEGSIIAGAVYHDYMPHAGVVQMSVAALPHSGWLTRETIRRCWSFPFQYLQCQMIIMVVPYEQERILRQLAVGGFAFVQMPRLMGRNRHAVIATLTEEDWAKNPLYRLPKPAPHPLDLPEFLDRRHELHSEEAV